MPKTYKEFIKEQRNIEYLRESDDLLSALYGKLFTGVFSFITDKAKKAASALKTKLFPNAEEIEKKNQKEAADKLGLSVDEYKKMKEDPEKFYKEKAAKDLAENKVRKDPDYYKKQIIAAEKEVDNNNKQLKKSAIADSKKNSKVKPEELKAAAETIKKIPETNKKESDKTDNSNAKEKSTVDLSKAQFKNPNPNGRKKTLSIESGLSSSNEDVKKAALAAKKKLLKESIEYLTEEDSIKDLVSTAFGSNDESSDNEDSNESSDDVSDDSAPPEEVQDDAEETTELETQFNNDNFDEIPLKDKINLFKHFIEESGYSIVDYKITDGNVNKMTIFGKLTDEVITQLNKLSKATDLKIKLENFKQEEKKYTILYITPTLTFDMFKNILNVKMKKEQEQQEL